ncbi:histidine kinase [Ekhidna sp.]|uniref:histidine kinase n=1 Tax=Ekhidna sp. TaxID=2608089 RepID=UPI0032969733
MKAFLSTTLFALLFITQAQERSIDELKTKLEDYSKNNLDSAIAYSALVIKESTNSKDELLRNKALIKLADTYIHFNLYNKADSTVKLVSNQLEKVDEVHLFRIRGRIFSEKDENDSALEQLYRALELSKLNKIVSLEPEIYFEIAAILRKNNDLENCTKYYRYAIAKAREVDNLDLEVRSNIQMCKVYNGWIIVNLDSSLYYGERAMQLSLNENYEYGYANAISIVSAPIIRKGQYRRGLEMSKEALGYAEEYNFSLMNRYYLIANLGFAYEGLEMYDSALYYMQEAGKLRPESLDYPRLKYRIYKAQKKYKDALEALEIYFAKSDSTQRNRNKTRLSNLQGRYEANLKAQELEAERELTNLQQGKLEQQWYLIVGMIVISLLLGFALMLVYRQRKLKQTQEITKIQLQQTQEKLAIEQQYRSSELKALRSQMNPHFIFNALNSIQEYIMLNEKKMAGKYLGKFADLMRMYLQHSQVRNVRLEEEIKALRLYLELEKLRFEETLKFSIDISDDVDSEISLPSLIIQPYVENSLKHGLLHKQGERILTINFRIDQATNHLECEIRDNGVGRKRSAEINQMNHSDHQPFAISAIATRINLLNSTLSSPIEQKVEDLYDKMGEPNGTSVIIRVPILSAEDWETKTGGLEISNSDLTSPSLI